MPLTSALMALTLLAQASTAPASQSTVTYKLAGRDVVVRFPQAANRPMADDVLNWKGFAFVPAGSRGTLPISATAGDWSGVQARYAAGKAAENAATPSWRTKIVIMTRTDVLDHGPDGVLRQRRATLEQNQLNDTLQEIARFATLVTAETGGAVKIDPDVEIEDETLRQDLGPNMSPFDAAFAQRYFRARINGGKFEAEDKVYRGPYKSVFYIHPGLGAADVSTSVNGMPVTGIALSASVLQGTRSPATDGALAATLWSSFVHDVMVAANRVGWNGFLPNVEMRSRRINLPDPIAIVPTGGWPIVASFDAISPDRLAANQVEQRVQGGGGSGKYESLFDLAPSSPNFTLKTTSDPDRGDVLQANEVGQSRTGAAMFPLKADHAALFSLADAPYLSFWVRSTSREPMALRLFPNRGTLAIDPNREAFYVAIGRDAPTPGGSPSGGSVIETAFTPNGKWQHVVADLRPLKAAGLDEVQSIAVGPSLNDLAWERNQLGPIEYQFDAIQALATPDGTATAAPKLSANLSSDDENERALAAATSTDTGALEKALADTSDLVKLNAANSLLQHPSPGATTALIAASHSVNGRVAETALRALWAEGSAPAKAEVRRLLTASPFDFTRQVAAGILAETKDAYLAGPISELYSRHSWQTREAGARAIAQLSGRDSAVILMVFLNEIDPEVRLATTELANPGNDTVVKRMLWSLVNDPSDAVRIASFAKLMETGKANAISNAVKAVHDDSSWVRLQVVDYLQAHPSEENRTALRQAVTDGDPAVRAAALLALAALEKPVVIDEVSNVLTDKYPVVQKALIDLAVKKGLSLPKATLDALRSSPDPSVVEKAKALGG